MPLTLTPLDLLLRLVLTVVAGGLVGINRGERGRSAGLRTTMLVCLAASFSMLLANSLMDTTGKTQMNFVQIDVMRLPLGILTGVGFLGAGAIVRKGSMVLGLTTAASLWFVTVMGLCFGAGRYLLGGAALACALGVIWILKRLEKLVRIDRRGNLTLRVVEHGPREEEVKRLLAESGFEIAASGLRVEGLPRCINYYYEVIWRAYSNDVSHPAFLRDLLRYEGVTEVDWSPQTLQERGAGS